MRAARVSASQVVALALTLVVSLGLASHRASAQGFPGTYSVRNQQGGVTTLVLTDAGTGKLGGTFSGNGSNFQVTGVVADDEATGVIAGRGLSLFFSAQVKGTTLLLVLAEPAGNGTPNMSTAQQVVMIRSAPGAAAAGVGAASSATGPAISSSGPTAAGARAMGVASAVTAQDKQLAQMFVANAWCAFSYSGSQTYSGSSGTTRTERVVMLADGRVLSNQKSEFAGSGESGSAVASNSGGVAGYWRITRGELAYSADGAQWKSAVSISKL